MSTRTPKAVIDLLNWLGPPAVEQLSALAADVMANGTKADATAALERARRAAIRGAAKAVYRSKGVPSIPPSKRK